MRKQYKIVHITYSGEAEFSDELQVMWNEGYRVVATMFSFHLPANVAIVTLERRSDARS